MQSQKYWQHATARERLLIALMAFVVLAALVFALLLRPAWRTVRSAPATLTTLDAQLLTMRERAAQLRATSAGAAGTSSAQTGATAAQPISAERELAGPGAAVTEDRGASGISIDFKNVDGARFATWLAHPAVRTQLQRLDIVRDRISGKVSGSAQLRAPA